MRDLVIRRESIESRAALDLINELNTELAHRYPEEGANYFRLEPSEVEPGHGAFLIARVEQLPVGCGAVRRIEPDTAEIKRMYVLPKYRSQGVGLALLDRLEQAARDLQVTRLVLETGVRQPESLGLYAKCGFAQIPLFGEYCNSPLSICMEKRIGARR
jgi:putative acetyltransferase